MKQIRQSLSIFTILLISVLGVFGQSDQGRIIGTVTDATGAIVQGASVTLKNEKTAETKTSTSSDDGTFRFVALLPTKYTVSVSAANFQTATQTGVELLVGQELNLALTLQAKGASAIVDVVSGDESAINTTSASQSVNVTPREVKDLPLNGRQVSLENYLFEQSRR